MLQNKHPVHHVSSVPLPHGLTTIDSVLSVGLSARLKTCKMELPENPGWIGAFDEWDEWERRRNIPSLFSPEIQRSFCFLFLTPTYRVLNFLSFNSLTSNEIVLPTYMPVIRYIKCSLQCLAHRRSSVTPLPTSLHWLKFSPTKCIETVRRGEERSGKAIEVRVVKCSECHRKSLAVYLCRWKNTKTGYHCPQGDTRSQRGTM